MADETVPRRNDPVFTGRDALDNEVAARVGGGTGKRAGIPQGIQNGDRAVEIRLPAPRYTAARPIGTPRPAAGDDALNSRTRLRSVLSDPERSRNLGRKAERLSEENCPEKDPNR